MNIAEVIGWKFNHQAGMDCREKDATGEMEIVNFPGGVPGVNYTVDGLPTQADQDAWMTEYNAWVAAGGPEDAQALAEIEQNKAIHAIVKKLADIENRLRIIEKGKEAVDEVTYKLAIKDDIKAL